MVCMNMLIPAVMLIFGNVFEKNAPKTINAVYGYRTTRSMKTQETWDFAQEYFSRLWKKAGKWLSIVSFPASIALYPFDTDTVGWLSLMLVMIQIMVLLGSIYPVEKALKQNFDKNGNRKEEIKQNAEK